MACLYFIEPKSEHFQHCNAGSGDIKASCLAGIGSFANNLIRALAFQLDDFSIRSCYVLPLIYPVISIIYRSNFL